ncbi:MAG: NnrU family protein [Rhodobacteraceae bacterium]|nr:NnrU family protein [Paracoccaceae bacterium]
MSLLITGLALWYVSHLMKRIAPGLRNAMGDMPGKLVISVLSLLAIVLMVMGYRAAPVVDIWSPPAFLLHINNLLMLGAVFLIELGYVPGLLRTKIRHPMLTAVKIWAIAHLLVNGDLASVLLFGGILAWAVIDLILINRQVPVWTPPSPGPVRNDLIYVVVAAVIFAVIGYVHTWLGYPPFG